MRDFFLALMLIAGIAGMPARAASGDDTGASTGAQSPSAASGPDGQAAKTAALSFVLLREPRLPDAATVRRRLETRLAGRLKVESVPTKVGEDDRLVMLFRVAGGTAMVGLLDRPLPAGEIDDLCRTAWYWPEACAETGKHRAHLIVSLLGTQLDGLDQSLLLTDLVAATMEGNDNAIASYWRSSLRPRDMFVRASAGASRAEPPVWLWVDFRLSREEDKSVSMSTDGLNAYGLREIEAKGVKQPVREVLNLVLGTATYLVSKGPVIKDGDTIGASPDLGIVVRHDKSYWREGAEVYRVVWTK